MTAHDVDTVVVTLHEVRLPCHLGWTDEERDRLQVVVANLELHISAPGVQHTDKLEDSIDYRDIVRRLENNCAERSWRLLEKMTFDIASDLLSQFRTLQKVCITVRKNIFPNAEGVSVSRTLARYN